MRAREERVFAASSPRVPTSSVADRPWSSSPLDRAHYFTRYRIILSTDIPRCRDVRNYARFRDRASHRNRLALSRGKVIFLYIEVDRIIHAHRQSLCAPEILSRIFEKREKNAVVYARQI